jgi:hypothetical protein
MPHSTKGVIAGFIATVVVSVVMLLLSALELTQFDIVTLIDRLGSIGRGGAWVDHFLVGTMLWGALFAGFDAVTPKVPLRLKGIIFGVGAWLLMMLIFMPAVGAGLFGANLGLAVPVAMLFLHLVYGAALGIAFELIDTWAQAKASEKARRV